MIDTAERIETARFHGSYQPQDCEFLLKPIVAEFTSVEEKERRIQSGEAHYSEMIHRESAPSPDYLELFESLCQRYADRLAGETRQLARQLKKEVGESETPIILISLVRAGTPAGALLRRALVEHEGQPAQHFSISIIRDRGIDERALAHLLDERAIDPERVFFIDAWTAKGVITRELRASIADFNRRRSAKGLATIPDRLAVISDIGGTADFAATCEDYAIPSGILNAPVSGLVSRSVWNHQIGEDDFHGCAIYDELAYLDQSQRFLDLVSDRMAANAGEGQPVDQSMLQHQRERMQSMLAYLQQCHGVEDINHIKPGIAEATRVMLRRVPALLIVKDMSHPDVEHLLLLAREKQVPVEVEERMPFHACSLIRNLKGVQA